MKRLLKPAVCTHDAVDVQLELGLTEVTGGCMPVYALPF